MKLFLIAALILSLVSRLHAFTASLRPRQLHPTLGRILQSASTADNADTEAETTSKGLFKRDRYVATNRFAVRKDKQAKFEKRWATRKSSLSKLEGFQYFHLMRRVTLNNDNDNDGSTTTYQGGETDEEAFENYVSFTIWNKKSHFSAWRSGEAFKEAHGGTSLGAFLSTMVSSALVLRGAPRPAFYDGLFLQKTVPENIPETTNGWRTVEADGVHTLDPECFVSFTKFFILSKDAKEFEQYWYQNQPDMTDVKGFVASSVMRRDGTAKGHGIVELQSTEPTYVVARVFKDLASYQAWAETEEEKGSLGEWPASFLAKRAPETVLYEGTLVISSAEGA